MDTGHSRQSRGSLHRFYVSPELLQTDEVVLPAAVARQLFRVLRLQAGARIVLFCGDGAEAVAVVERLGPQEGSARILERRSPAVELACRLEMAVAVLKGEKLDWVIQKLTEVGVYRIHLVQTERTVVAAGEERWTRRLERYTRIAVEAAEQSGRVRVPEVVEPVPLRKLVEAARELPCMLLHPGAERHLAASLQPCPGRLLVLVGPEGGLTDAEVAVAQAAGAQTAAFGPRILRAETAAIAAASVVAALSDCRTLQG